MLKAWRQAGSDARLERAAFAPGKGLDRFVLLFRQERGPLDSIPYHVFIVESDPAIAQAIATVVLEALPSDADAVVARSAGVRSAKRLLDRLPTAGNATVIVVCAADLADGGRGIDVLAYARDRHPQARVVLMTSGEREELGGAIAHRVDGIVGRSDALRPLRIILEYLAREPRPERAAVAARDLVETLEGADFQRAVAAVEAALEAVERAHDQLAGATGAQAAAARRALTEAEILAVELHRRMLDAERRLLGGAAPAVRE